VAILSGCESSVVTSIEVLDSGANVSVLVEFEGDIARTLRDDPQSLSSLETKLSQMARDIETREVGASYIIRPDAAELKSAGMVNGVGDVSIVRTGSRVEVLVETVEPTELKEAIAAAVQGEPDAGALEATMLENTFLEVQIVFQGEVIEYNGGIVDGSAVRYRASTKDWATGTLVAKGRDGGRSVWPWVAGVAVVMTTIIYLKRYRPR